MKIVSFVILLFPLYFFGQAGWSNWGGTVLNNVNQNMMWNQLRNDNVTGEVGLPVEELFDDKGQLKIAKIPPMDFTFEPRIKLRTALFKNLQKRLMDEIPEVKHPENFSDLAVMVIPKGFNANNLADTSTILIQALWQLANEKYTKDFSVSMIVLKSLQEQLVQLLSEVAQELKPDSGSIQEASDQMVFALYITMLKAKEIYTDNPSLIPELAIEATKEGINLVGFDLRRVKLTQLGFIPNN